GLRVKGNVSFVGWATGPCPIEMIEVLCDGKRVAQTNVGIPRPDIAAAYPQLAGAQWSGYGLIWDASRVATGPPLLAVQVSDTGGAVKTIESEIVVEEPGPSHSMRLLRDAAKASNGPVIEAGIQPITLRPLISPMCKRFALYTSSLGNYFFGEIRDLLAAG